MDMRILKVTYFLAILIAFFAATQFMFYEQGGRLGTVISSFFPAQETSCMTTADFKRMVGDMTGATAYAYMLADDKGKSMDTAKIIFSEEKGKYLAVYHSADGNFFSVWLAESDDLITWQQKAKLFDYTDRASQPYIAKINNKYYVAVEKDTGTTSYVLIKRYSDVNDLYSNTEDRTLTIPLTFSASNDGTPSLTDTGSRILLGFHWNDDAAKADKQAVGYLDYDLNGYSGLKKIDVFESSIKSNIGDRDFITVAGVPMVVVEGNQAYRGDANFEKYWRIYVGEVKNDLNNINSYSITQVDVKNNFGQNSFANPSISIVPSPKDHSKSALLVSYFNFGSLGQVIFYYELGCGQPSSSSTIFSTSPTTLSSSTTASTSSTTTAAETTISTTIKTTISSTTTSPNVIIKREVDYSRLITIGCILILTLAILFVYIRTRGKKAEEMKRK